MNVAVHVEFMRALGKLSARDRKATEDMMLRIQAGGITPGMRRHQIVADNEPLTSLSASMDLRVLAIEDSSGITMLYVDHHDKAYQWAYRNQGRLGTVVPLLLAETAMQSALPADTALASAENPLASRLRNAGFPPAVCKFLSSAGTEDELLDLAQLMAPEWQELVIDALSTNHRQAAPITRSNIWVAPDDASLRAALALPLSQWRIFLHPSQLEAISADISRDVVVVGGPGTGKTVALIHRARRLAALCTEKQKIILVGHSPQAVSDMKGMMRELAGCDLTKVEVLDMIAIGRDGAPRWGDVVGPSRSSDGYLVHRGQDVMALLIDESQDVHRTTKSYIFGRRPEVRSHVTAAVDLNQNIFAKNTENDTYLKFLDRSRIIHLRYSYRIPREAGMLACELLRRSSAENRCGETQTVARLRALSREMSFGFATDFINVYAYSEISSALKHASRRKHELELSGIKNIGIVFCGNSGDRRKYEEDLRLLGYDPVADRGVSTTRSVKGAEFEYCFVIAPELLLRADKTALAFAYHQIFVALSRCRKGLAVYAASHFAAQLVHPGVEITLL
jgi:hypothetical protein